MMAQHAHQIGWIEHIAPRDADEGMGALNTARGHLPLKRLEVRAELVGLVARTTVRQVFVNTYDEPLEATYIFPLPARGAVSRFELRVAGRRVEGLLQARDEARQTYARAIEAGHRAAIVEEERPDVFTMRVGNLPPGEDAVVELVMVAPLDFYRGEATWRFPLVVAPRYIPGRPLASPHSGSGVSPDTDATPDASRITPPTLIEGYPNPVELELSASIDACGLHIEELGSTLHAAHVERSAGRAFVRVAPGERLNRDFVLRFRVSGDAVSTSAAATPASAGRPGVIQLTVVPPHALATSRRPRDVAFVLDRSGSMQGWKMVAARRAVGRMIDSLGADDRFAVLAFDNTIEWIGNAGALTPASNRARYRAIEALSAVDARGGTEMAHPLRDALSCLSARGDSGGDGASGAGERVRWLVLVTDGQVGNEAQLLKHVEGGLSGGTTRIFTVGIDRSVNEGFLRRLAELGKGHCELVESEERLDEVMDRAHHAIEAPLITHLSARLEGGALLGNEGWTPSRTDALFAGQPLRLAARYEGVLSSDARVILEGHDALGDMWRATVPVVARESEAIEAFWARGRLRELEDRIAIGQGNAKAIEQKMVELSLMYRVLCRFTAFVAVDRQEVIERNGPTRQVTVPVEPVSQAPQELPGAMPDPLRARMAATSSEGGAARTKRREMAPVPMLHEYAESELGASVARPRPAAPAAPAAPIVQPGSPFGGPPPAGAVFPMSASSAFDAPFDRNADRLEPVTRNASEQTRSGVMMMANLAWMPPEGVRGLPLDETSVVYALGLLLYWMLNNQHVIPFQSSDFGTLEAITRGERQRPLWRSGVAVSAQLEELFREMTHLERNARPTLAESLARLEALCANAPLKAGALDTQMRYALGALSVTTAERITLEQFTRSAPLNEAMAVALCAELARILSGLDSTLAAGLLLPDKVLVGACGVVELEGVSTTRSQDGLGGLLSRIGKAFGF